MYDVVMYYTESGKIPVKEFINDLNKRNQTVAATAISDYITLLKQYGTLVNTVKPKAIKLVDKKNRIWELRPGNNRVFFFHFTGTKFVLLHAYKKQSQEMPRQEIEQAIREMKDYKRRANE